MLQVVITGAAAAWSAETGAEITAFESLRGLNVAAAGGRTCSEFFDEPLLRESGVTGGAVWCRFDVPAQALRVITTYQLARPLTPEELDLLVRETVAQWTDGLGESGFGEQAGRLGLRIQLLPPDRERGLRVEQVSDAAPVTPKPPLRLLAAATRGDLAALRRALEEGEDPRATGQYGLTALHWAVRNDQPEAAQLLLERGADPNVRDETGMTPLAAAAALGLTELARLLLEAGADVNGRLQPDEAAVDVAPLLMACNRKQPELARLLIERGADVNLRDSSGYTPLAMLGAGDVALAQLLLDRGANPRPGKWLRKVNPTLLRRLGL